MRAVQRGVLRGVGPDIIRANTDIETIFNAADGTPAGFTFSRASVAWRQDSNFDWRSVASGVPRNGANKHYVQGPFYPISGMLMEPAASNKFTGKTANPTDNTGWTKGGDAAATLTVVSDPGTLLDDAGLLAAMCTLGVLWKLDNSAGVADAYIDAVQFGATSGHIVSLWVNGQGSFTRTGGGTPETLSFDNAALVRTGMRVTPNASTDQWRVIAPPGEILYLIQPQIEVGLYTQWVDDGSYMAAPAAPTSPIVNTSATPVTRALDSLVHLDAVSEEWFSQSEGALIVEYAPLGFSSGQRLFSISAGAVVSGASANGHSVAYNNAQGKWRSITTINGTNPSGFCTAGIPKFSQYNRIGYSWNASVVSLLSEVMLNQADTAAATLPNGINRIRIGGNAGGSSNFFGLIREFIFVNKRKDTGALGRYIFNQNSNIIGLIGQSVAVSYVQDAYNDENAGEVKGLQAMEDAFPGGDNHIINMAYGGSSLLKETSGDAVNWYIDDGGTAGAVVELGLRWYGIERQLQAIKAAGVTNFILLWDQQNAGIPDTLADGQNRYKEALLNLRDMMVEILGVDTWMVLEFCNSRGGGNPNQRLRDVYTDLVQNYSYFTKAPELVDRVLTDATHPSAQSMYDTGQRSINKCLSLLPGADVPFGVDGPRVVSVSRSGLDVTFVVAHDDGTDATLSSGLEGAFYFDNSTMVYNGGTQTFAKIAPNTYQFTLASPPSGVERFYYFYSGSPSVDTAAMFRDNSAQGLLLNGINVVVPYSE